jgi:hypothetical protein
VIVEDHQFYRRASLEGQSVITSTVTMAEGVFAPGHVGELTQIIAFEMVDEVLAERCGLVDVTVEVGGWEHECCGSAIELG